MEKEQETFDIFRMNLKKFADNKEKDSVLSIDRLGF